MPNPTPRQLRPPNPTGKGGFRKNVSGNPGGLRAGEVAKKVFKVHTQASIALALSRCLWLTQKELTARTLAQDLPMAEQVVAKALLADSKNGVLYNFEKILERILGKVPQPILQSWIGVAPNDFSSLSDQELDGVIVDAFKKR